MPIRQRKIYWSSDLQLHVSYTRWHAMRGSEVHFTRLRMGFETGEYPRKISGQFFGKQRLNACVDSQGWADKSDRTFDFEIHFLIFFAVLAPERAIFYSRFWVSVGRSRSGRRTRKQKRRAFFFSGTARRKTHAKSSLGRPEAPGGGSLDAGLGAFAILHSRRARLVPRCERGK